MWLCVCVFAETKLCFFFLKLKYVTYTYTYIQWCTHISVYKKDKIFVHMWLYVTFVDAYPYILSLKRKLERRKRNLAVMKNCPLPLFSDPRSEFSCLLTFTMNTMDLKEKCFLKPWVMLSMQRYNDIRYIRTSFYSTTLVVGILYIWEYRQKSLG